MKKLTVYSVVLALVVMGLGLTANAAVLVEDDFNRYINGNDTVGTMSDGVHNWYEYEVADDRCRVNHNNALWITYAAASSSQGVAVRNSDNSDYTLDDGIIKIRNTYIAGGTGYVAASVTYRAASLADAASTYSTSAYHLRIYTDWSGSKDIALYYGHSDAADLLGQASLADAWEETTYEIHFEGNSHKVYANGVLVINGIEDTAGRTGAGCIGMGVYSASVKLDDFQVLTIPEPATMSLLLLGLPLVLRRRKR